MTRFTSVTRLNVILTVSKTHFALQADVSVWELMGLRMDGLVAASILALLLTMVSQGIPYLINLILHSKY